PHADGMVDGLWDLLEKKAGDPRRRFRTAAARFRAAAALAAYDPTNPRWDAAGRWVVEQLVAQPSLVLSRWVEALRPAGGPLTPALAALFRDSPTPVAAAILGEYASDEPEVLADALGYAPPESFAVLFPRLQQHPKRAVQAVTA